MTYLLDVNVLIAALWVNHTEHARADAWIRDKTVATCPISELGFLRISSHPKAIHAELATARELLRTFIEKSHAEFVADDLPSLKSRPRKNEEITDFYLADLALRSHMKLATLDSRIAHAGVELIPPLSKAGSIG